MPLTEGSDERRRDMKESRTWGGKPAIAGVLVVVLFLPMVGAITDIGQGIAYGQARGPDVERFFSAECSKLRRDTTWRSEDLEHYRGNLASDKRYSEINYKGILEILVEATNLRDQIAGLDAAAVFVATGDTRVSGLLQAMRKKAEAQLAELKKQYGRLMGDLSDDLRRQEFSEAKVNELERTVADLRRKSSAAGCDLPPLGSLISFLPAPSALGAPLPPTPTTQVPGSVTRVPPKQPSACGTWKWNSGTGWTTVRLSSD